MRYGWLPYRLQESMMISSETWKPISGYEGRYEVSDMGRVRSLHFRGHRGSKVMTTVRNYSGYHVVSLGSKPKKQYRVHVLVLEAFVGPRPEGMQGCHRDDDKDDNRLCSLRWDTPKANAAERNTASGERHGNSKLSDTQRSEIVSARRTGEKIADIAKRYGITDVRVSQLYKKSLRTTPTVV